MYYDRSGNVYREAGVDDDQVLVHQQIDYGDDEAGDGELRLVKRSSLSESPPRARFDNQTAQARAILKELNATIHVRRQELRTFETEAEGRMARLKQHKGLELLDQFVAGKITHYVEAVYGPPTIMPLEEAIYKDSWGRSRGQKLLTLFGKSGGELAWGLNCYTDGSGSNRTVTPCTSHEDAIRVASEIFAAHEAKTLDPEHRQKPEERWLERAAEYGIEMSDAYKEALEVREAAARDGTIAKLESELQKLREPKGKGD